MVLEPRSPRCGPLMGEGVIFHTFTLPDDRCARLLVKNLGRGMPESVVREELRTWAFMSWGSRSCISAVVTRTPPRTCLPPPTSLYQWHDGLRCPGCAQSPNSAACECPWCRIWLQRALAKQALPALTHAGKLRLRASVRRRWGLPPVRWTLNSAGAASVLRLWG